VRTARRRPDGRPYSARSRAAGSAREATRAGR
jgi:hypothetical protein